MQLVFEKKPKSIMLNGQGSLLWKLIVFIDILHPIFMLIVLHIRKLKDINFHTSITNVTSFLHCNEGRIEHLAISCISFTAVLYCSNPGIIVIQQIYN